MTRTNYTKVEEALKEGMRQIELKKLNKEAAIKEGKASPPDAREERIKQKILATKLALKWAWKQDREFYAKKNIDRSLVKSLLEEPTLTDEQSAILDGVLEKIEVFKKEFEARQGIKSDEELIEKQRKRHITKRFNINDKWLPLK